jgi:hypothetical protein
MTVMKESTLWKSSLKLHKWKEGKWLPFEKVHSLKSVILCRNVCNKYNMRCRVVLIGYAKTSRLRCVICKCCIQYTRRVVIILIPYFKIWIHNYFFNTISSIQIRNFVLSLFVIHKFLLYILRDGYKHFV